MRRAASVIGAMSLVLTFVLASPSPATIDLDRSKLTPAMADLVANGYRNFPIQHVVRDHRPGDLYYLAKVGGGIDGGLLGALEGAGAQVRYTFPEIGYVALASRPEAVAAVAQIGQVELLEIDRIHDVVGIETTVLPAATAFADQTKRGTHDVGADALWKTGVTGQGVTIGVTDTGIDSLHPDVGPKIVDFVDCTVVLPSLFAGDVGQCQPGQGYDDNGHGTHVSGIAAGSATGLLPTHAGLLPGMAPDASLAGAKVCLAVGSCLNSSVMAGLRYLATDQAQGGAGADIVNVSLGSGRFYFAPFFGAEQVTNNDPEAQLVNELALQYNVLFTISAGNSGPVLQSVGSPSVAAQALSVAAGITDWDLNHPVGETIHGEFGNIRPEAAAAGATAIATFSSRGPSGDPMVKPEVVAPGSYYVAAESTEGGEVAAADVAHGHFWSADKTYAVLSGTSMSAPAAAGAAALVWGGYEAMFGQEPPYYRVKAALVNTAGTHAFEGPIVGLISGIRAKLIDSPEALFPLRNQEWVGLTGEGAGRINAPAALLALTKGIVVHTAGGGAADDIGQLQPSWSIEDVGLGETATRTFIAHGAPGIKKATIAFSAESGPEATGVNAAPVSWFRFPRRATVPANADVPLQLSVAVPQSAAPGLYTATIVGQAVIDRKVTQNLRIPVQVFVELRDADPAEGSGTSVEGPIWASEPTDYSVIGFEDPLGDIHTDWAMFPMRIAAGTDRVDLAVYDVDGRDHMDFFVFTDDGLEVDSTVTPFLAHATPGDVLYSPTTRDRPARRSILDGDDLQDLALPATVWVVVSDSGPDSVGFSTFHLDVDVVAAGGGGGATPAERIHSGQHAWWSGSASDADSHLTQGFDLPAEAAELRFWTWYDLEDGFDWAYVLVSTNGGQTWESLATTAENGSGTTPLDPIGDAGGVLGGSKQHENGLTGASGFPPFAGQGLIEPALVEHVADLTPYAGQSVLLRFAYTSDAAVNHPNFYVDDISILAADGTVIFTDDVETAGGWEPGGNPGFSWITAEGG
jgi:subtilisin family serine protease